MTNAISHLVVERVDVLPGRAGRIYVTGALSGEPVSIGDTVSVQNGDETTTTTIKSIEIHSPPGKTTIVLDADLRPIINAGTVIQRWA
ncbi:hypothetical protein [Nocardia sp. BMG51109]|uniref:hypothetical protein n=1 Tax=Nocardia sp. BMG51109 TaxID=1056816 RepID=UPI0004632F71|nr:hypothetical protein [Nocardia sp. BMG51109]